MSVIGMDDVIDLGLSDIYSRHPCVSHILAWIDGNKLVRLIAYCPVFSLLLFPLSYSRRFLFSPISFSLLPILLSHLLVFLSVLHLFPGVFFDFPVSFFLSSLLYYFLFWLASPPYYWDFLFSNSSFLALGPFVVLMDDFLLYLVLYQQCKFMRMLHLFLKYIPIDTLDRPHPFSRWSAEKLSRYFPLIKERTTRFNLQARSAFWLSFKATESADVYYFFFQDYPMVSFKISSVFLKFLRVLCSIKQRQNFG